MAGAPSLRIINSDLTKEAMLAVILRANELAIAKVKFRCLSIRRLLPFRSDLRMLTGDLSSSCPIVAGVEERSAALNKLQLTLNRMHAGVLIWQIQTSLAF